MLAFFFVISSSLWAGDQLPEGISDVKSFTDIIKPIQAHDLLSVESLLVLDDDDTLIHYPCAHPKTSDCQYLGTPGWEAWQKQLLATSPNSAYLAAKSMDGIYAVSDRVRSLSRMSLIEAHSEQTLLANTIKAHGHMIVTTARSPSDVGMTARQLKGNHLLLSFAEYGIKINGLASAVYPWFVPGLKRSIRYEQGIMYLTGQNKGIVVRALIEQYAPNIKQVVFIDGAMKNVQQFVAAFVHSPIKVYGFHYTRLLNQQAAIMNNAFEQQQAKKQWDALSSGRMTPVVSLA